MRESEGVSEPRKCRREEKWTRGSETEGEREGVSE